MKDVSDIFRIGQVTELDPENCRVRVSFDDIRDVDGNPLVSWWMAVRQQRTVNCQTFDMPDIGEHVMIASLPSGIEEGFVLGSYYTAGNLPKNPNERGGEFPEGEGSGYGRNGLYRTQYADGTIIEYDLNAHEARVYTRYDVFVECKNATVIAEEKIFIECKNAVVEAHENINVTAGGNITINAQGNIFVNAEGAIDVKSATSVSVEAPVIDLN
jgi:phage baseplate assembly protein V